jgi:hypothetical protein
MGDVLAETSSLAMIASTIVHEATHARLMRCGIWYETELRRGRNRLVCVGSSLLRLSCQTGPSA